MGSKRKQKQFDVALPKHLCDKKNVGYLYNNKSNSFFNKTLFKLKKLRMSLRFLLTKKGVK